MSRLFLLGPAGVRDSVAHALDLSPLTFQAKLTRGQHGTKVLAAARAAACWAIHRRYPRLSHREIGEVVGLKRSAVQQAILRAPRVFKASELARFAGRQA